jgi:hypothetical protein
MWNPPGARRRKMNFSRKRKIIDLYENEKKEF